MTDLKSKLQVGASRTLRFIGGTILFLAALQALGAFTPSLPILGFLGSLLIPQWAPWFVVFAILAAAFSFWRWHMYRRKGALVATMLAAMTALSAGTAFAMMVHRATACGVHISLAQTFTHTSVMKGASPDEVASYGSFEGKPLEVILYRPAQPSKPGPAPVLLYVHGGGWVAGTKEDRGRDMRWFANNGWMVFSISYGLSTKERPMWADATSQVGCAMVWLASHSGRYGGDISRLSLIGESAGGNLVLNSAYMANSNKLISSCGGVIPKVKAVIAAYPVVSADAEFHNPDLLMSGFGREMAIRYTGGTPQEFPDRYTAVQSSTHISPAAPPTLVIEGERDHLVPPQATYDFVDRARAAGVDVSLIPDTFR